MKIKRFFLFSLLFTAFFPQILRASSPASLTPQDLKQIFYVPSPDIAFVSRPSVKVAVLSCLKRQEGRLTPALFAFQIIPQGGKLTKETTSSFSLLWPIQFDAEGFADELAVPFYAPENTTSFDLTTVVCNKGQCARETFVLPLHLPVGPRLESGMCSYLDRVAKRHPDGKSMGIRLSEISLQGNLLRLRINTAQDISYLRVMEEGKALYVPMIKQIGTREYLVSTLLPFSPKTGQSFLLTDRQRGLSFAVTEDTPLSDFHPVYAKTGSIFPWIIAAFVLMLAGAMGLRFFKEHRGIPDRPVSLPTFKSLKESLLRFVRAHPRVR